MKQKHVPMRTCIQCRQVRAKRELVRIVRTPEGDIQIDEKGKVSGRGAYLCRSRPCWEQAVAQNRLQHALKTKLDSQQKGQLLEYGARFPDGEQHEYKAERSLAKGADSSHGGVKPKRADPDAQT